MEKKNNIPFLTDTPKGTKMYLVIQNRVLTEAWIKEAVYQGFTKHYRKDTYMDCMKMSRPCEYTVTEYHVKFTVDGKSITVVCDSPDYWNGQRGYNTNEHLECGASYKTKMNVGVTGCIDVYFTTDRTLAKKFLEGKGDDGDQAVDGVIKNVNNNLDAEIERLQNMKDNFNKMVSIVTAEISEIINK